MASLIPCPVRTWAQREQRINSRANHDNDQRPDASPRAPASVALSVCVAHRTSIAHHSTSYQRRKKRKKRFVALHTKPYPQSHMSEAQAQGSGPRQEQAQEQAHCRALRHGACQIGPGSARNGFRVAIVPPCGAWGFGLPSWWGVRGRWQRWRNLAERTTDLDTDMDLERRVRSGDNRGRTPSCRGATPSPPLPILTHTPACSTAALGWAGRGYTSYRIVNLPSDYRIRYPGTPCPALPCPALMSMSQAPTLASRGR
jgi:hypothetical protein